MAETLKELRQKATRLHQDEKLDEAARAYAQYLKHMPNEAAVWSNLGALYRKQSRHTQALRAHERAFALRPDDIGTRNNYANILSDLGQYEASILHRRWILEREPDSQSHLSMIGRCLRGMGDYAAAITHLEAAIKDHPSEPELKMQLAFAQLGAGKYEAAFANYKARWDAGELKPRNLPFPEWQGETLTGKTVLVMPEQGFGDAVLFSRFLPVLKDLGATVHCIVERPLAQIFDGVDGADWTGPAVAKNADIDYWVNMMDLAAIHFAQSHDVPAPVRLNIPESSRQRARQITAPFADKFKVGVVWTGSVTYKGNAFRSFSHTDFLPLADIAGVQLFSLYKGPMLEPYFADGSSAFIVDAGSDERGFADTAATMEEMDLIITSDTATAHIAGSVATPTWTVLHWDAFWVWRHNGDTTDWYPKMRLFRQDAPLDWAGTLSKVKDALLRYLDE